MTTFIYQWALNIAAIAVLTTIFEMLLPQSAMKKFGRIGFGLVMVYAILKPLVTLL